MEAAILLVLLVPLLCVIWVCDHQGSCCGVDEIEEFELTAPRPDDELLAVHDVLDAFSLRQVGVFALDSRLSSRRA